MRLRRTERQFPERVNRILNCILVALCVLVVRSWHLAVVQHEERCLEAERPKQKTVWVTPQRGPILDRFGLPLALNRETFRAAILYSAIREIPRLAWVNRQGKRVRVRVRGDYISALSQKLGAELNMDPGRIEDQIHSEGALFPHLPTLVQENLTLEQFHRLKLMERDWPGLVVEVAPQRQYPAGQSLAHVVGYLGRIGGDEVNRWRATLGLLEAAEAQDPSALMEVVEMGVDPSRIAEARLHHRRLGYTSADWSGKTGVEKLCEERLRGLCGIEKFETDTSGRRLRSLGAPLPVCQGEPIALTISLELQQEAERLLKEAESTRACVEQAPAQLGGGIVALDPRTGEVLCLATTPSFDPNAFVQQSPAVAEFLETDRWMAQVWDGILPISMEAIQVPLASASSSGATTLSWDLFLNRLVGSDHPAAQVALQTTLGQAFEALDRLGQEPELSDENLDCLAAVLPKWPSKRSQRLLALDCIRLGTAFDMRALVPRSWMDWKISRWRSLQQDLLRLENSLRVHAKTQFHHQEFSAWRREEQKRWLTGKRKEEKQRRRPHKPYLALLDGEEARQFSGWWKEHAAAICSSLIEQRHSPWTQWESALDEADRLALSRLRRLHAGVGGQPLPWRELSRGHEQLTDPLWGRYPYLRNRGRQTLADLARAFMPPSSLGAMRSFAFQQIAPLGSIFKLVVAAEALRQSENRYGKPRPELWTIHEHAVQEGKRITQVGTMADGRVIPRVYQGGRLPLTAYRYFGRMDLMAAIERSSNPFFALLTVEALRSPLDLLEAARDWGFGSRSHIGLGGEAPGWLPTDLEQNRSGLYAFSIGQHESRCTPLQAALMLGTLANGGELLQPRILANQPRQVRRQLPLSAEVRQTLLKGMHRVIHGVSGSARVAQVRKDGCSQELKQTYARMAPFMVGKTGTAQILETLSPDPDQGVQMVQHVWFGSIVYPTVEKAAEQSDPELVVVVFLRFANGGREGAPLAAQVAERWREICARRASL